MGKGPGKSWGRKTHIRNEEERRVGGGRVGVTALGGIQDLLWKGKRREPKRAKVRTKVWPMGKKKKRVRKRGYEGEKKKRKRTDPRKATCFFIQPVTQRGGAQCRERLGGALRGGKRSVGQALQRGDIRAKQAGPKETWRLRRDVRKRFTRLGEKMRGKKKEYLPKPFIFVEVVMNKSVCEGRSNSPTGGTRGEQSGGDRGHKNLALLGRREVRPGGPAIRKYVKHQRTWSLWGC